MALTVAQLTAKVSAEGVDKTKSDLEGVGKKAEETKGHFEGLKNALSTAAGFAIFGGLSAGFGILKDQIGSVISLTEEHQQVTAQTVNVIRSMHDASGETAVQIENMAEAISHVTPYSEDAVQAGENMLMTFGNIGKKTFPEATQAVVDFANFMGLDVTQAALQVGKALNDPATGMANLQREGVRLSPALQETVKHLEAVGNVAGAQKIVLQELEREFGGSAEAAGKTFGGQLAILGHQFDEIKIKIGTALLPVLSDLLNKYVVPLVSKFQDWMIKGGGLNDFKIWIQQAVSLFENQFLPDLNKLLNQYIIPLATQFYNLFIQSGFLKQVWTDTSGVLQTLMPLLGGLVTDTTNFLQWLQKGGAGVDAFKVALAGIGTVIAGIKFAGWLNDANKAIGNVIESAGKMKQTFTDFINWFGDTFLSKFKSSTDSATDGVKGVGDAASTTQGEVEGIGAASATAEGEVATSTVAEEADLEAVGVAGRAGAVGVASIGVAAAEALGPLTAAFMIIKWFVDNHATIMEDLNNALPGGQPGVGTDIVNNTGGTGIPLPWGPNSYLGHASGILNNPSGHWATIGERGPETMYVPGGASILPSGVLPPMASGGGGTAILQIDGYQLARLLMPYVASNIRNNVGMVGV